MSYNDIFKLLGNCRVQNKVFTVHDYATKENYPVDINNVIRFFKEYTDYLYCKDLKEWNKMPLFMLGEVAGEVIPVISEFKFKSEKSFEDTDWKKITHNLINCHQEVFNELILISPNADEYTCVVLISVEYKEEEIFCKKIKLIFPYCRVSRSNLISIFRKRILKQIRKNKLDNFFGDNKPIGSWSQHFFHIADFYPLYGSTDNIKDAPTCFEAVYGEFNDGECRVIPLENAFDFKNYQYIKSGQCVTEEIDTLVDDDGSQQGNYDASIRLLTVFISINFGSHVSRIKENNLNSMETSSSADATETNSGDFDPDPSELEIAIEMIDMLNINRFEEENYFLEIGKALYHASKGGEDGLTIWFRAADDRACGYTMEFCRNSYHKFDEDHITVKTLAWYARKDNTQAYQQWHNNWCLPKLQRCYREQDDIIIAEAFYRVFWLDYFFHNKHWFKFDKSRLKKFKDEVYLRNDITEKFIPKFISLRSQICEQQINIKAHAAKSRRLEEENKDLEAHLAAITKLIKKLSSDRSRNILVRCSRDLFHKEDAEKLLNINPNLLGVKNGVIEILDNKAVFRPGKPEDYITKKTGVSYRSEYNYSHPDIKKILLYFRQVFPNEQVNHHMKKDVASMLYGRNPEKVFRMWIGDTNGSKSIFQSILKTMFGDYYCDLPAEFFSASQKNSSGPNPELAQLKGARVAFSAEPDDDTDFKGARIKKMTGNDSFFARGCGEDGGSIEATFKMFMVLNIVPNISGMDYATLKRLSMILFEGQWLKHNEAKMAGLPTDIEEQIKLKKYVQDDRIENDIPRLSSALLWLAVDYYKTYRAEGIENPPYVTEWMEAYWKKHDPHNAFINERIENSKMRVPCDDCCEEEEEDKKCCLNCEGTGFVEKINTKKYITASDIFPDFKRWMKETYPNSKAINKTRMTEILSSKDKLGKQIDNRWYGYKIKEYEVNMIGD